MAAAVAAYNKEFSVIDTCLAGPGCGGFLSNIVRDKSYVTWTAGGGLEFGLSGGWSIKGEYPYIDTEETYTACGPGNPGFTNCVTSTDPGVHTAKLGINYRFGASGAPAVARY